MSFLFSGRDSVDVPPIRVPSSRGSGRSRMAGERSFLNEAASNEPETESSESVMQETSEREGRGRRAGRRVGRRRIRGRRRGRGRRKFDFRIGGRRGVRKTRGERPEGMPPRGPSKGTKYVTMRDPETGYKYGGKVVDGVPQFTKPDFSDRKPLPGYPKKDTDRVTSGKGKGKGKGKGTKYVTMRDPETGYKYGGKVVDGVPQFTKPDFSDRKPLPGYPKKDTDRPTGTGGKRSDPRGPNRPPRNPNRDEIQFDLGSPSDDRPGIRPPKTTKPPTGGRGPRRDPRRDPNRDEIQFDLGFPSDDRPGIRPPTGGRGPRRDPRPPRPEGGRGRGERGRRRVRDEAFERRRRGGSPRSISREERRRRVRVANTRK